MRRHLAVLAAALSACAAPRPAAPPWAAGDGSGLTLAVPFFPRVGDGGSSALAEVLTYWGYPTDPRLLDGEFGAQRAGAPLPVDLHEAAQRRGLRAEMFHGTEPSLKSELRAGRPVIAVVRLGRKDEPSYAVVTGFDDRRSGVYVHSGGRRHRFLPSRQFLQAWERSERLALVILPPTDATTPAARVTAREE